MTVLLVLFTLIAFLVADYIIQRKKRQIFVSEALRPALTLSPQQWHLSNDIALAPNHTWLRRERDNSVTVGIDNFVISLTGAVERIQLPIEGALVNPQSPTFALRDKERTLRFASPIEGQIVSVNNELLHSPSLAKSNPYTAGWLFKLIPSDEAKSLTEFVRGEKAIEWLKKQNEVVKEFLNLHSPQLQFATMQDGGVPVDGVLKGFDAKVWKEFEQKFVPMQPLSESANIGEYDNA
jgi:glycine cleavage system H protein